MNKLPKKDRNFRNFFPFIPENDTTFGQRLPFFPLERSPPGELSVRAFPALDADYVFLL